MKKIFMTLFILATLCLSACGWGTDWVDLRDKHTVVLKEVWANGTTVYTLRNQNQRDFKLYAKEEFADVRDTVVYEDGKIIVIKREDIKKEQKNETSTNN